MKNVSHRLVGTTREICFAILIVCSIQTNAQTYLGISANVGNRLKFTPDSEGLRRPVSISGSIVLNVNRSLKNGWAIQYGGGLGVLGFILKIVSIDTLTPSGDVSKFYEYTNLYANANGLVGKKIPIGRKKLLIGAGGGVTCYLNPPSSYSYGIDMIDDGQTEWNLFDAAIDSPIKRFVPFANIDLQLKLSRVIVVALGYSYHFKPLFQGTYAFYQTETPSSGEITLYQRELTIKCLVNVKPKARE